MFRFAVADAAGGGDAIVGEANVAAVAAADVHLNRIGLRHLHDALDERLRLLARHARESRAAAPRSPRARHAFLPVLITLMLRKRAGTQPWLTEPI